MFSRANISANYKKYTKCIKSVKNAIDKTQQNAKSVISIVQEKIEGQKDKVRSASLNQKYKMNVESQAMDYIKDEQEYLKRLGIKEFRHIEETNDGEEYLGRLGVNEFRNNEEKPRTNDNEEYLSRLGVNNFSDFQTTKQNTIKSTTILENCKHAIGVLQDKVEKGTKKVYNLQSKVSISLKNQKYTLGAGFMGASSPVTITEPVVELIPEPPPIPEGAAAETISQVNALGEASLESLGLGGWTPVGIVQNCFEFLHVSFGLPWWGTIAVGTVVIRCLLFPLVVIAQRNAAKMNNHLPQMQVLQLKMTEARQSGNQLEVARYSQELMVFMKEKNLNPFKNMLVPFAQMPVFISFFVGLRQMANVPVDSLRTGGMLWFTDLTVPDQFFALPVITSLTLWATIELGTDSAKLSSQNLQTMKYVLRALPVVILPFTVNFPGAILCYWVSSNFISLAQVGFLRIPKVRDYFKIDPLIKHEKLPVKNKGFVGGIKESWTNIKITKELEERRRLDEMQFQRAGKGPLVKTYKYDPTKQVSGKPAVSAKNR